MKKSKDVKILVIGDIMIDHYIVGKVEKISPEAPVPVVDVSREYSTLGGAGNVAYNLSELGADVTMCARIGNDEAGKKVTSYLARCGIHNKLVFDPWLPTTQKIRVIAKYREMQMLRIDKESRKPETDSQFLWDLFDEKYDVVIISDYAKGFITEQLMEVVRSHNTDKCRVIIDPKPQHSHMYHEVFMVTPNTKELREMKRSYSVPYCKYLLETKGKRGMLLINNHEGKEYEIKGKPVEVYNVTGAGDSVISVMALGIGLGYHPQDVAEVANECAAFVVTQPGTTTVPKNLFETRIGAYKRCHI